MADSAEMSLKPERNLPRDVARAGYKVPARKKPCPDQGIQRKRMTTAPTEQLQGGNSCTE